MAMEQHPSLLLSLHQNQLMSSQVPLLVTSPRDIVRPISNFVPDVWGDQFLNYEPENSEKQLVEENELGKLKEEVRNMFFTATDDLFHQLKLIDDIQRLGVAYHFEREIKEALENIYAAYLDHRLDDNFDDLNYVSLCFRLLRQQGINISSDVFNKFKDKNGILKESLTSDVEGLLSLYEAAYLAVKEETVLDEALGFSTTHLQSFVKQESSVLSNMVSKALYRPLRKSLTRVNATHFISVYKDLPSYNETLLRFAVLDFNLLQRMHKNELSHLTKWWRDIDIGNKFPFARDRMVECFFWATGVRFEPKFWFLRKILAKHLYLLTILDDIYDSYGTHEELVLFTQRSKRWSSESTKDLPEYMKLFYEILLDFFEEVEESMVKQRTSYRTFYAKEEMTILIQSYFDEANWRTEKNTPTIEEYLTVSTTSSTYAVVSAICFVCVAADAAVEKDFQWLSKRPKILKATEFICRVMDDIVSYEREKETGHVATAIECYSTQHGTTEEEAIRILNDLISEAWKDINEELLEPTCIKRDLLLMILHMTQVMDELYKEEDNYTMVGNIVKEGISLLFINQVSM